MPEYRSLDVYVEEVPSGLKPIKGVPTSIIGMVGITERGPPHRPTLVTSFGKFMHVFGGFLDADSFAPDQRMLPHAVKGAFDNGATRIYVSRVGDDVESDLRAGDGITDADYIGRPAAGERAGSGLEALADVDEISLIAVPGRTSAAVQTAMVTHCERMRDRFAILDSGAGTSAVDVRAQRQHYDSAYAALYYPWLTVADSAGDGTLDVPPSGHICGAIARQDERRGVHKAPANLTLRSVIGLQHDATSGEQSLLNPNGINVIRDFSSRDRGIRIWGARTISADPEWRYIAMRRLALFLEESITRGIEFAVFEPNDEPLWARVEHLVMNFLMTIWRQGALAGSKAEDGFFVKVGRQTMSRADVDANRLIVHVGFAPLKPAEFVVLRIVKSARRR